MLEVEEKHRDLLADLVDNCSWLGRSFGPTKKHVPFRWLELLSALLDDYEQAAFTYSAWHQDTKAARWRTEVLVDSVRRGRKLLQKGGWAEANLRATTRKSGLREQLQLWYKRSDYVPDAKHFASQANGEEYPHPEDLLYLFAVVLEALKHWAWTGSLLFPSNSEENELAKKWEDLAVELQQVLVSSFLKAQKGTEKDWEEKTSLWESLFG